MFLLESPRHCCRGLLFLRNHRPSSGQSKEKLVLEFLVKSFIELAG